MHTAKLNTTFYRGGQGSLRHGQAYFCSCPDMAAFYGPVSSYTLKLQSLKFVSAEEWARFDSTLLRFDDSAVTELIEAGHDSAILVTHTPKGRQIVTVFVVDGLSASTKLKPRINVSEMVQGWGLSWFKGRRRFEAGLATYRDAQAFRAKLTGPLDSDEQIKTACLAAQGGE